MMRPSSDRRIAVHWYSGNCVASLRRSLVNTPSAVAAAISNRVAASSATRSILVPAASSPIVGDRKSHRFARVSRAASVGAHRAIRSIHAATVKILPSVRGSYCTITSFSGAM